MQASASPSTARCRTGVGSHPWRRAGGIVLLSVASLCAAAREQPPAVEALLKGDDSIVVRGRDGGPVVTSGKRFGGSIVSVYYRGVEYVNNDAAGRVDYGRQLQSAAHYRGVGECFNPTEAGGKYDKGRPQSSSRLLSYSTPDTATLLTETDMAFWMAPGVKKQNRNATCTALNTDVRGGYRLKRTLRVGVEGFSGAIQYDTQFFSPVRESGARYEAVVIHTPSRFTRVFRLRRGAPPVELKGRGEQGPMPHLQASADLAHSVVVCNTAPQNEHYYGFRRTPTITTSRYVEFSTSETMESRLFSNYVIVGTFDEVRRAASVLCLGEK